MLRMRRCKIIATLGPASANEAVVAALVKAGADVFRINMSHATHEQMRAQIKIIRTVEAELNTRIGVLLDLQGPKLRIGAFADRAVKLVKGATFTLDNNPAPGDNARVWLPHPEILLALRPGHTLLIDDGKVRLTVASADAGRAVAIVEIAGEISNRKGVSLPDTEIPVSPMTAKDRADLEAGLQEGVDWIAVSFVQRPEDVVEVKKLTRGRALVMSKIEKPQAISRLDEIVEVSDGLMVARGDLGVEMPLERVPGLQKRINRTARRLGKPVVVATQMLESMINAPVPTRAEVSDVATAVFEGADAVMLSAESAAGQYPVEAVATMNKIAAEVERDPYYRGIISAQRAVPEATGADAIAVAARNVAETLDLKAIVAWTSSGATAMRIARERPEAPVLALTPHPETAGRLALVWGVHAIVAKDAHDIDDMSSRACKWAVREGFGKAGDRIIVVAGVPFGSPGATNMVRIALLDDEPD
ncbi:pyruvate kinase [Methylocapsa palsarum]|uniref:Pyruvate kinase n=1 Tax=Methylocapsa palsarum TaxID=1612308 RepID=A0A1I4A9G7_9HYPH|nr:pyruvate kinase [Methylocapsa palsarum]SFK52737.1 pyruvate kinase [Methylocapsa palsarum]